MAEQRLVDMSISLRISRNSSQSWHLNSSSVCERIHLSMSVRGKGASSPVLLPMRTDWQIDCRCLELGAEEFKLRGLHLLFFVFGNE